MTTPIPARGRGRGRGNTLPAWMTHQRSGNDDDEGGNRRGESMSTSISATTTTMTSEHRQNREEDRRQRRPDDKYDRISSPSSAYDRGYGREQRDWDTRERIDSDRNYRDQTYHYRDRDRMPPDSRRNAATDHRGHHGLGYDERGGRGGGEREMSWERDRAEGSGSVGWGRGGRNENEMNFVRGRSELMYGGDRDDRDSDEDRGRGDAVSSGMGRGRGRGGTNINAPAWMTAGSGSSGGPVGQTSNIDPNGTTPMGKDNQSMELLLAQARQVQQKLENPSRHDGKHINLNYSKSATNTSDVVINGGNNSNERIEAAEKLQQRQLEEANEAARKVAEDEFRRLEQLREEEERRQLLALVGDQTDDENRMDSMEDISSDNNKPKHGLGEEEDDNNILFEFETEEEREERLARKRREERRKKLKTMQAEHAVDANAAAATTIVVDQPRNVAGIIHSELHDGKGGTDDDIVMHAEATPNNVHMHSSQVIQTTEQNNGSSSNDSFDMFATDNATPVPIHPSTNNSMITSTKTMSNRYTSANSNAQECDDAEGYYRASIGEIITLPKENVDDAYQYARDESDRISRFRVLGIVGKGVFSSVIKCVEETNCAPPDPNAGASGETNNTAGRVIAMKIIRNNEVMAKAAAKEMRILRMLCHQPTKSKSKNKPARTENSGANGETNNSGNSEGIDDDDDDDGGERERENHHIVRLLDVDPTSKDNLYSTSVYAAPPPEFRSHCVFLFEFLPYNLREVLSKFGKNVGINLTAVRSYARQLLCALAHLERHRVVHGTLYDLFF
jgi:hypothetical protein